MPKAYYIDGFGWSTEFKSEWAAWKNMKARCLNKNNPGWKRYGGRGIRICQRWRSSFRNFLTDMGKKPATDAVLDRINNEGHYTPRNCRWTTPKSSSRNTRRNRRLTHAGLTLTVAEWAERLGVGYDFVWTRLRRGWSVSKTLTDAAKLVVRRFTYKGETKKLTEWSRQLNVKNNTVLARIRRGWTVHDALFTPIQEERRRKETGRAIHPGSLPISS